MALVQEALQWIYIATCFVLIWYGISLVLGIWIWIFEERVTRRVISPFIKLALTAVLARVVVWLGAVTSV